MINANVKKGGSFLQRLRKEMRTHPTLYLLMIPFVLYYILFDYVPMYGVTIAFQNYNVVKGIGGSDWVGLHHFKRFLNSYYFDRLVGNTLAPIPSAAPFKPSAIFPISFPPWSYAASSASSLIKTAS